MHDPHAPHRSDYYTVHRERDGKVVYHYLPTAVSGGSHYQLFDLKNDPFEQTHPAAQRPEEAVYPVDKEGKPLTQKLP